MSKPDAEFEDNLQDASNKCIEFLSEFLEAGTIIGTYRDSEGKTQKWSQFWGNEFAVAKITEVQYQEDQMMNAMCIGETDE